MTIGGWERERQQRETNLGILIKMSNDKENFLDLWLIVSMNQSQLMQTILERRWERRLGLQDQHHVTQMLLIRLRNSPIWFFILVLEANPVLLQDSLLRCLMLLRLPTIHSFGLFERPSKTELYVGGSLLWCAYDYIASLY